MKYVKYVEPKLGWQEFQTRVEDEKANDLAPGTVADDPFPDVPFRDPKEATT